MQARYWYVLGHLAAVGLGLAGVLLGGRALSRHDFVFGLGGMSCWAVCMAANEWLSHHQRSRQPPPTSEDGE